FNVGVSTVTWTVDNGCETATCSIQVTINPLLVSTVDITLCANEFPATILGHIFTGPGSLVDTVASTAGCDTIRTINVTELPLLTTEVNIAVCASEFPYTFAGHVFDGPGSLVDTVGSTAGCDTIRTI